MNEISVADLEYFEADPDSDFNFVADLYPDPAPYPPCSMRAWKKFGQYFCRMDILDTITIEEFATAYRIWYSWS